MAHRRTSRVAQFSPYLRRPDGKIGIFSVHRGCRDARHLRPPALPGTVKPALAPEVCTADWTVPTPSATRRGLPTGAIFDPSPFAVTKLRWDTSRSASSSVPVSVTFPKACLTASVGPNWSWPLATPACDPHGHKQVQARSVPANSRKTELTKNHPTGEMPFGPQE